MKSILKSSVAVIILVLLLANQVSHTTFAADYVKGANSASTSYKSSVYYDNLKAVPLTGDGRLDVIAVALSQLGYQEGNSDGDYSGTVAGSNNFTEFNRNMGSFGYGYGGSNYPWCASFVSFCLLQSGCTTQNSISDWCRSHQGDSKYIWREVSCQKWADQLRTCGYFKTRDSYTPVSGDLIFFKSSGSSKETHIGLVLYADGSKVYTVEGNTSSGSGLDTNGGGVYFKSYSLTSTYISGYGRLPYKENADAQKIDYSGAAPTAGLYMATKNKYVYENENNADYKWLLPKFAMFTVTGVASNGRLVAKCTINGVEVEGYVKNNTDRVIQMTVTPMETGSGSPDDNTGGETDGGATGGGENTVTLTKIEVTSLPRKLIYLIGEDLKADGLALTATYSDNSTAPLTDYTLSGFSSVAAGEISVKVTSGNAETSFSVTVCAPVDSSSAFADVKTNAWYKPYLDTALSYQMVSGNGAGKFDPEGVVTRAQFVQMLANISGVDTSDKRVDAGFHDVKSGTWYAPAVKWAAENGIVSGNDKGCFAPDDEMTREQMCLIIANYVEKYLKMSLTPVKDQKTFEDDRQISSWAKDAVYACQRAGLVSGVDAKNFAPKATANRASAATLLVNFHEGYVK